MSADLIRELRDTATTWGTFSDAPIRDLLRRAADELSRATPPSPSTAEPWGYALFRNGKQVGVERTKRQADSWVDAVAVPLGPLGPMQSPNTASEVGELRAALRAVNAVAIERGDKFGACDQIDNEGKPYQSQWFSSLLSGAALAAKTAEREENPYPHRLEKYADLRKGTGWMQCRCGAKGPVLPDSQCPAAIKEARAATQPSTGEVDVEAEFEAWFANEYGLIAAMPKGEYSMLKTGYFAGRHTQAEGAKEEVTDAMADAGAEVLWDGTRTRAIECAKQDKFDSCADQAREVYRAMRAKSTEQPK